MFSSKSLIPCVTCKAKISPNASSCPRCGEPDAGAKAWDSYLNGPDEEPLLQKLLELFGILVGWVLGLGQLFVWYTMTAVILYFLSFGSLDLFFGHDPTKWLADLIRWFLDLF